MYKYIVTVLSFFLFFGIRAQTLTETEITKIKHLSLNSLHTVEDPSNKFLNKEGARALGKALFNDSRLSSNGKVSCRTCHIEQYAFTDKKKLASGLREGFRNTPTLLNVSHQHWFFADGAKDSIWAQNLSSIENPAEQNFTRLEVMRLISTDKLYRKQYDRLFEHDLPNQSDLDQYPLKAGPNGELKDLISWKKLTKNQRHSINLVFTNIGKAIASYVSILESKPTRFDKYVDDIKEKTISSYLNASELRGLKLFLSQKSGCSNCHSGPIFSNKSFHNIGTGIPAKDNGRSEVIESVLRDPFNCLGIYSDAKPEQCSELNYINRNKHQLRGTYKTSTLRSISKTAPYMHDGRFETLEEVIKHYIFIGQSETIKTDLSPISLTEKEQLDLVSFLSTL